MKPFCCFSLFFTSMAGEAGFQLFVCACVSAVISAQRSEVKPASPTHTHKYTLTNTKRQNGNS